MPVEFALPLLTMAVIFYWTVKRPDQLPTILVFLIGLFTDIATASPLGFWALSFLLAVAVGSFGVDRLGDGWRDMLVVLAVFAATVAAVSLIGWLLSSLFVLRPTPVRPLLLGGAIAVVAYPLISYLLAPLDRAVGQALAVGQLRTDDYE